MVFIHINKKNCNKYGKILDKYLRNKKTKVFLLIYMEGCGPCNETRPEWKKLENILKHTRSNNNIIISDVDSGCVDSIKTIQPPPNSFPTLRYISDNISENYEDCNLSGEKNRSVDSFIEWINSKTSNLKLTGGGKKTKKQRKRK